MLLFLCIPRKDTNEIAHRLLNKFGSLNGVFFADISELVTVPGIKRITAIKIRFIGALFVEILNERTEVPDCFDRFHKVANFLRNKFFGKTHETVFLMTLDNSLRMIECVEVGHGTVNLAEPSIRTIMSKASADGVSAVILAHNHPNGVSVPSTADIDFTYSIDSMLSAMGVTLLDHIIVGESSIESVMRGASGSVRPAPNGGDEREFYQEFYYGD